MALDKATLAQALQDALDELAELAQASPEDTDLINETFADLVSSAIHEYTEDLEDVISEIQDQLEETETSGSSASSTETTDAKEYPETYEIETNASLYTDDLSGFAAGVGTDVLKGEGFLRPAGVNKVSVLGKFVTTAGSPVISLVLEGSHDNLTYHEIARSNTNSTFTTNGDKYALGDLETYSVNVARWNYLRVRAAGTTTGTWTLSVLVSGIATAGTKTVTKEILSRSGATTLTGATRSRREGTQFLTIQAVFSDVSLGGGSIITCALEGSPDGGDTFFTIATAFVTADGSNVILQNGSQLIDLGGWTKHRIKITDDGVTDYTAKIYMGSDSSDYLTNLSASSTNLSNSFKSALYRVTAQASAEDSNVIEVSGTVNDIDGNPINQAVLLRLVISTTQYAGIRTPSGDSSFTAVNTGTLIAGSGTNDLIVRTSSTGDFNVDVTNTYAQTVYVMAVNGGPSNTNPLICASSTEVECVFT